MSIVQNALRSFEAGYNMTDTIKRGQREQRMQARREKIGNMLAGGNDPMQSAGAQALGVTGIVPPDQQGTPSMPPPQAAQAPQGPANALGGQPSQSPLNQPQARDERFSRAAKAAFDGGDFELGEQLHNMHMETRAAEKRAQTEQGKAREDALRQTLDLALVAKQSPEMFERVKAFAAQNGVPGVDTMTYDQVDSQIQMMQAMLSDPDNNMVLKDNETVFNPVANKVVYSNRGNDTVADGAALIGKDGQEIYRNDKDFAPAAPVKPTADMQNYETAQKAGFKGSFYDYQTGLKQSGRSTTTVSVGAEQTAGRKKLDEIAAKNIYDWMSGGAVDTRKQINQLSESLGVLNSDSKVTGFVEGNAPEPLLAILNPEAVEVRDQIAEVVQRNLRVILGAQFTQEEGKALIARAFNAKLPQATQAKRVTNLLTQMRLAADAKDAQAKYFQENGTLIGYEGKQPSKADFENAVGGVSVGNPKSNTPTTSNFTQDADGAYVWSGN